MIYYEINKNTDEVKIDPINGEVQLIPKDVALSKELAQVRGDFFAVLVQDQLYFGMKTRNNIDSLFKSNSSHKRAWWSTPDSAYKRLVEVMMSELK